MMMMMFVVMRPDGAMNGAANVSTTICRLDDDYFCIRCVSVCVQMMIDCPFICFKLLHLTNSRLTLSTRPSTHNLIHPIGPYFDNIARKPLPTCMIHPLHSSPPKPNWVHQFMITWSFSDSVVDCC